MFPKYPIRTITRCNDNTYSEWCRDQPIVVHILDNKDEIVCLCGATPNRELQGRDYTFLTAQDAYDRYEYKCKECFTHIRAQVALLGCIKL